MRTYSMVKILLINLDHQKSQRSTDVIKNATYKDFLGMIDRGNHLPLNTNKPTNKFLKKFIVKAHSKATVKPTVKNKCLKNLLLANG
jgi:coproporphyrinogen III oxidase